MSAACGLPFTQSGGLTPLAGQPSEPVLAMDGLFALASKPPTLFVHGAKLVAHPMCHHRAAVCRHPPHQGGMDILLILALAFLAGLVAMPVLMAAAFFFGPTPPAKSDPTGPALTEVQSWAHKWHAKVPSP